jgi:uncharacterized protein DUF4242
VHVVPRNKENDMPTYLIERNIDGLGDVPPDEMRAIAEKSCSVLRDLGTDIQWVHSYVTADKMYCVYRSTDDELVREHARSGGFPADRVEQVTSVVDPTTAEG